MSLNIWATNVIKCVLKNFHKSSNLATLEKLQQAVAVLWLRGRLSFTGCTLYLFFVDRQPISSLLNLDLVRLLLKKIIYVYTGLYLKLSL